MVAADAVPPRRLAWVAAPSTVVGRLVARRAVRSGAGWGAVFGVYVAVSAKGYAAAYPDAASRLQLARSLGDNVGLAALLGPARAIDTVAGFTAWRCLGVLTLVGAVWGMLTATRLLRGEEDAGRWELLLAGQTTRRQATAQALGGLAAGWVALWAVCGVLTVSAGRSVDPEFPVGQALLLATAVCASAALFLAVGALASQLAASRRQAAALSAGVLGVAFLVRMIADSGSRLDGLRWATPLGWLEGVHPLTGSRPLLLLPVAALTALLAALAVHLAGRRDLGGSTLPAHDSARPRTWWLTGPAGLALRTARPVAVGWTAAIAACGLVFGLVAQSAAAASAGSTSAQEILRRLGAQQEGASAYLGITFLVITTLVLLVAAGQVTAARDEEGSGRLDNLLVRPVGRLQWLAGRLGVAAGLVVVCGLVAGVAAWVGTASQNSDVGLPSLLQAGINTVPPALLVLGLGTLVHATLPRLAATVTYGVIAWSFLVELIGSAIDAGRWLLETSVLYHVAPAPATPPDWIAAACLAGAGALAAAAGAILLQRRDLAAS